MGKTEAETAERIEMMAKCLRPVVDAIKDAASRLTPSPTGAVFTKFMERKNRGAAA